MTYDTQGRRVLQGHPSRWEDECEQLRARVQELEAALHGVMIGGNHLGLIIGAEHPAFTEDHEAALRHYGAGAQYEAWCCWKAIMQARAALQKQEGE